jgi:molecular chaperone GrpE
MENPVDPVAFEPPPPDDWSGPPPPYPPGGDPTAPPSFPPPERGVPDSPASFDDTHVSPGVTIEQLEVAMAAGVNSILTEFRDKLALDHFKEEQITRLHEELQEYRNDLISRTARQILLGLIRFHDNLGRVAAALRQRPVEELTTELFFKQLEGFQDDVELLLGQHEVEKFEASEEEFDPRRQTSVRTLYTENPAQVGRIAERVRSGFQLGETLLQKERVAVYAAANGANAKT